MALTQAEWNRLPRDGPQLGNRPPPAQPPQQEQQPAGTFPPLSAAWAPARQAETEAEAEAEAARYRETLRRAEALHAERMAGFWTPVRQAETEAEQMARMNNIHAPLPKGVNKHRNKSKAIEHYEAMLREIQAIKQLKLSNAQSIIAYFITGEETGSINQQENRIKQLLQTLRSVHQNAGTRHRRKHSKRRFRATRRKMT